MKTAIITIPIYKTDLDPNEIKSLRQCFKILAKHPIVFFGPQNLDTTTYQKLSQENNVNFVFEAFDEKFFKDRNGYSHLMLSPEFYQRFSDYKFLLLYQTDAYVFKDELKYWCDQNYDYVGAPWFEIINGCVRENSPMLKQAGNGGFSLRKISTHLKALRKADKARYFKISRIFKNLLKEKKHQNFFDLLKKSLSKYFCPENSFLNFVNNSNIEEDIVWVTKIPKRVMRIKIAPPKIAAKFSFELQPKKLFQITKGSLPFGCHAFYSCGNEHFWVDEIKAIEK